jgi:hypothetical protein
MACWSPCLKPAVRVLVNVCVFVCVKACVALNPARVTRLTNGVFRFVDRRSRLYCGGVVRWQLSFLPLFYRLPALEGLFVLSLAGV